MINKINKNYRLNPEWQKIHEKKLAEQREKRYLKKLPFYEVKKRAENIKEEEKKEERRILTKENRIERRLKKYLKLIKELNIGIKIIINDPNISFLRTLIIQHFTNNTMRCPHCKIVKINDRRWKIDINNISINNIICKSCSYINKEISDDPFHLKFLIEQKLFSIGKISYKLNSLQLSICREELKISIAEFANFCGWSKSYQYSLESGNINVVSEETKRKIENVLKYTNNQIFSIKYTKYYLDGNILKRIRKNLEISIKTFAEIAGWSIGYQHTLESLEKRLISEEKRKMILETINRFVSHSC